MATRTMAEREGALRETAGSRSSQANAPVAGAPSRAAKKEMAMETVAENMRRCYGNPDKELHLNGGVRARHWKHWSASMRDGFAGASQNAVWYSGSKDEDAFCIFDEQDGRAVLEFYLDDQEPVIIDRILPSQVVPMVIRLLGK